MAFDQSTRNRLQRFVTDARRTLEEEFTRQLQNDYGLDPISGTASPLESLRHINDQQRETARILRDTLAHYCANADTDTKAGLDRIVREQAFTVLNRLAAIKMAEARGLIMESIGSKREFPDEDFRIYKSYGFQLYARLAGTGLGETGDAYRVYLQSVFDELSQDLPGLFDRFSPQGRLFPREAALIQVLTLINHGEIEPLWAEDETIGWIYQYFNSKEERKAMRDASQAPRNSRELAVRNQFFTPRYVVEFLVDNTLGRLWFNWTGGQTGLRDRCQYLLVKPDEQPEPAKRLRDPRTIKLLDPACGSMHFGLYAFDLFLEIYREAWAWEQTHGPGCLDSETGGSADLKPLSQTYADQDAFLHDVPRLIIEHNIYGVDIDPRAAQIASLALWLRAQRAWHEAGVKAKDRPQVGRGQVVAAVAPPAEVDLRKRFMEELDPLDAELFEKTLFLLKGLPELGVLLQVEKELPALVRAVFGEHGDLFREEDMAQWQKAEARLSEALTEFARAARSTYQGRLFAEDALQGLRMIDHCREKYDVIVMNPPFGLPGANSKNYIFSTYPDAKYDMFACFVRRSFELLRKNGFIGALTNRTAFSLDSLAAWRDTLFLSEGRLTGAIDLGYGVLDDAMVEAAAYVTSRDQGIRTFRVVSALDSSEKQAAIENSINNIDTNNNVFEHAHEVFRDLPGNPISYFVPRPIVEKIRALPEIRECKVETRSGLQTSDDFRFLRLRWEVKPRVDEDCDDWIYLSKGGDYQPIAPSLHLLARWANNGLEMKSYAEGLYKQWSRTIQSMDYQKTAGITYSERTTSDLSLRIMPKNCLFTKTGPGIFGENSAQTLAIIAASYSRLSRLACEMFIGSGDESVSGSAARHYRPALIGTFPMLVNDENESALAEATQISLKAWRRLASSLETSSFFCGFPINANYNDFSEFCTFMEEVRLDCLTTLCSIQGNIEDITLKASLLTQEEVDSLDKIIGPSPHSYPDIAITEGLLQEVERLWAASEEELVAIAKSKCGARRQLVKMSFYSDRKLELMSHILEANPKSIIAAIKGNPALTSRSPRKLSEEIVSYLFGLAFGRWSKATHLDLAARVEGAEPFSPLPLYSPREVGSSDAAKSILESQGPNADQLIDCLRDALLDSFGEAGNLFEHEIARAIGVKSLSDYVNAPTGFFSFHLQQYSESRRKAPIYWPISTSSGSYTLWLYYPSLTDQTLFTAVNDFIEPKLSQVGQDVAALRTKGSARSRDDEKTFEALQTLELELIELRDTLLAIAQTYRPNQDDGVQITAAPLWRLFRHKPWQKVLKTTWEKLEKGDYDWAHLAMAYWPDRVREKCEADKSLAIAHDLEHLYVEPEPKPTKARGRKKNG